MSINWVMLDKNTGFVRLNGEKVLFTSPARTTLELSSPSSYPGKEPISIHCSNGKAYLTNQRLVYLPIASTPRFQSFSAPILNLQDTHVTAPFFGANVFAGILRPVPGGNIPPHHAFVEIKMTFKEGGAFDFSSTYERIKEQMTQALDIARESGRTGAGDLPAADLEQLPAYEENGTGSPLPPLATAQPSSNTPISSQAPAQDATHAAPGGESNENAEANQNYPPPNEPPPGYEETQAATVASDLEENIRRLS
ncbi:MAG: hypothetical protein HETSPECPRED_002786 [Heterodermia speciosa]|uniref:WW domain-binding protein n=1 Tax=Heterodermia speciosa TaxID=116794 RepID=A0A8H3F0R1_9LECA|nr:MAG: hypothetical protein HETSPECPRED_002786 [Heterodermia speciosa]